MSGVVLLAATALLFLSIELPAVAARSSPGDSSVIPHPDPDAVADQLISEVALSRGRMSLAAGNAPSPCQTGNPIDDCWMCDSDWQSNRKRLADCAVGFGRNATGGKDGQEYVVTDPSDSGDFRHPNPGTLRYGLLQKEPLWIVFSKDMTIELSQDLLVGSYKTIDGRGAAVHVTGAGCLYLKNVTNVIIHNIHIHDCKKGKQDGDGITARASKNVWVDHCTLSNCTDGLLDFTHACTGITISNNHLHHHDKVMLLGHSDKFTQDSVMQVTVAFNRFGEGLMERMPRVRFGYVHVTNNDYLGWGVYAVGGSSNPTINSQGNRYKPSSNECKEVTRRMVKKNSTDWKEWNWRSKGDLMLDGAVFVASGKVDDSVYVMATSMKPMSADDVGKLTKNAGVIGNTY